MRHRFRLIDTVLRCKRCNTITGWQAHPAGDLIKLPPEVRLKVYRFVFGSSYTDNGTQRRIHWQGGTIYRPISQILICPRLRTFIDIAILSTCRFIYGEAQPELMATSTAIVKVEHTKALVRYTNVLKSMRYLEIRDSENERGRQLVLTQRNRGTWLPEEKEAAFRNLTYVLRIIKPVVDAAPQLQKAIIGFEVLRVLADSRDGYVGRSRPQGNYAASAQPLRTGATRVPHVQRYR